MRRLRIEARWRVRAAIVALPAAVAGCLSPTDITLEITSDLPCSKLSGVAITAGPHGTVEAQPAKAVTTSCSGRDGGASFGTLVLVPQTSADTEITVRVVAGVAPIEGGACAADDDYAGCIVVRRVLHYEEHTELTLPIEAHGSCSEVRCIGEDVTCVDGVCLPSKIDDPSRCAGDGCTQAKLFDGVKSPGCLGDRDFAALGTLPGIPSSIFGALSADGRVVFGYSAKVAANGAPDTKEARAFRCASEGELTPVAGPHDRALVLQACDGSGSSAAGYDYVGGAFAAARWSAGQAVELPALDLSSEVIGCDRTSCTKLAGDTAGDPVFWRSPEHPPVLLHGKNAAAAGYASGVDPSGRFAFGNWLNQAGVWDAPADAWHQLALDNAESNVNQATPDGASLVGFSTGAHSFLGHAMLWKAVVPWTKYEGTKLAPVPAPDANCAVSAISDDGTILTGFCGPPGQTVAALWEERSGFAPVVMASRVAAPSGWKLLRADVSADGAVVAGTALDPQKRFVAYIARLK